MAAPGALARSALTGTRPSMTGSQCPLATFTVISPPANTADMINGPDARVVDPTAVSTPSRLVRETHTPSEVATAAAPTDYRVAPVRD